MISASAVTRRLAIAHRALAWAIDHGHHHGPTLHRIEAAYEDLTELLKPPTIDRALAHIADHAAGYPTTSMPAPAGRGGHSDRTLTTAVPEGRRDRVLDDTDTIEQLTARLQTEALHLAGRDQAYQRAKTIETDARVLRSTLKAWAREPDIRWCRHCLTTNGHRAPVPPGSRYRDLCRPCGDWRSVNKKLPHKDFLPYLQRGERHRIPQRLLAKHRAKLPRAPRTTRKTKKPAEESS